MDLSCGTLAYCAPEVLKQNYTNQCDMWSFGVIVFILLAGYMPFSGSESNQMKAITSGKYNMKPEKWTGVSKLAKQFVGKLLVVEPTVRMSAKEALEHPWIKDKAHHEEMHIDLEVVES